MFQAIIQELRRRWLELKPAHHHVVTTIRHRNQNMLSIQHKFIRHVWRGNVLHADSSSNFPWSERFAYSSEIVSSVGHRKWAYITSHGLFFLAYFEIIVRRAIMWLKFIKFIWFLQATDYYIQHLQIAELRQQKKTRKISFHFHINFAFVLSLVWAFHRFSLKIIPPSHSSTWGYYLGIKRRWKSFLMKHDEMMSLLSDSVHSEILSRNLENLHS